MPKQRIWTDEQLKDAVATSTSIAQVLRKLGLKNAGGTQANIVNWIAKLKLDTSHFTGQHWNKENYSNTVFAYDGRGSHKKVLIIERGHMCEKCNRKTWLGENITLELEHIDGDRKNNSRENLKLLCPNCHSLTKTWRGRNINTGKIKVDDSTLLSALQTESSIRKALNKVGLTPKGGNYERCYKLLSPSGEIGDTRLP